MTDEISDEHFEWYQRTFTDDARPIPSARSAAVTRAWAAYIQRELDRRDERLLKVIGALASDEATAREAAIAELRAELEAVRGQIDVARRLDALEARLADVVSRETSRPPAGALRAV